MRSPWSVALVLLGAACASSGTTSAPPPAPGPQPGPRPPTMDPGRIPPPAELVAQYPRAGAGTARYRLERRDSVSATMPTGEVQVQLLGHAAYVTLNWVAADSGTRITAALDSVVEDSAGPIPFAEADSARGARWVAFRPPTGALRVDSASRSSRLTDQIRDQLVLLFPHLPPGGARPGASWSDSVDVPARVSGFEVVVSVLSQATAEGEATPGMLPIQVTATRHAEGEATQFGQTIGIHALGQDSLSYELTPEGRVTSVVGHRTTDLRFDFAAVGQSVPAVETTRFRMTFLR